MERAFIDTNILIYYFGKEDSAKFSGSYNLITNPKLHLVTSTQVLSEFASVFLRKNLMGKEEVKNHLQKIASAFEVVDFSVAEILKAVDYKAKYQLSFYDSLIVTNAILSHCKILYSEDLHHNLIIEKKLKVVNPFK